MLSREIGFSVNMRSSSHSDDVKELLQGIEKSVYQPFLERNDCVLGNRDGLRTYLTAARGDIAIADVVLLSQVAHAVLNIERMHFKRGHMNQQARADEFLMFVVLAQNVTYVLTEKTLDALAKFLHPFYVCLLHAPCSIRQVG